MTEAEIKDINKTYFKLLDDQYAAVEELDYTILEQHIPSLKSLAGISNSVISIFDVHKKEHVFYSSNLGVILGYSLQEVYDGRQHFLDAKIHPDDFAMLVQNALFVLTLFSDLPQEEKFKHKLISEYRILDASGSYVRVIEQQQVLALDRKGNLWLALSIFDLSPNQKNLNEGLTSKLLNFKTGEIVPFAELKEEKNIRLTKRETEVLKLVRDGLLSKEISEKLDISLHTVNTYRQRVLEKFGANNSIEAVMMASERGII